VEKKDLPPAMLNRLLRLAAFQNPEFYKSQAMRLSTYDKPRIIACGQDFPQHIAVPRGCLTETLALLEVHKIRPVVRDERFAGTVIETEFQGQLRPFQEEAVAQITVHDEGILCAPTAFGKTAVAEIAAGAGCWSHSRRRKRGLPQLFRERRPRLAVHTDGSVPAVSSRCCAWERRAAGRCSAKSFSKRAAPNVLTKGADQFRPYPGIS
jgi:hypothetical protein